MDSSVIDSQVDAGPVCISDPDPHGIGTCTSNADCLPHCNAAWAVSCVASAYDNPVGQGRCLYQDCRVPSFRIDYTRTCPSAECPGLCGAAFSVIRGCAGTNGYCVYGMLDGG